MAIRLYGAVYITELRSVQELPNIAGFAPYLTNLNVYSTENKE